MSLRTSYLKFLPSWLTKDDGGKVNDSLADMMVTAINRIRDGLISRFPAYAPEDALAALGRDRRIVRGINEPAASYAARLSRAFDDHKRRGNPFAMLAQIQAYLQAPVVVRTIDRRGNYYTRAADGTESAVTSSGFPFDWDGVAESPNWARFWVVIYPVNGIPWSPSGTIGSPTLWGNGKIGNPGKTIGTTATPDQVASVRAIIRDWKPGGSKCEWVIIAFDPTSFYLGSTDPAGGWRNWSDGAGNPVRLSTARYWAGGAT